MGCGSDVRLYPPMSFAVSSRGRDLKAYEASCDVVIFYSEHQILISRSPTVSPSCIDSVGAQELCKLISLESSKVCLFSVRRMLSFGYGLPMRRMFTISLRHLRTVMFAAKRRLSPS
jgi:hypothetical protein